MIREPQLPVPGSGPEAEEPQRLRKILPHELAEDQRRVYDAVAGGRRAQGTQAFRLIDDNGGLEGPFNAFLLQPEIGFALQELGTAIRYRTNLSSRAREIAILVVAAQWDSAFERAAHERVARQAGLTEEELAAIRHGRYDDLLSDEDRELARTTLDLVAHGDLDDKCYADAVRLLGVSGLFELTTLVGYYATLALQLRIFRVGSPALPE
jgi:4-carboxymuconolactone decarboxylase